MDRSIRRSTDNSKLSAKGSMIRATIMGGGSQDAETRIFSPNNSVADKTNRNNMFNRS